MLPIESYTKVASRVSLLLVVFATLTFALLLISLSFSSGLREEDLRYLLLFAVLGCIGGAIALLTVDLTGCIVALIRSSRSAGGGFDWKTRILQVGRVFVAPILLWLMSWLALFVSRFA